MPTVIIPPTDVSPYTGTGDQVLANTPTLVTPVIGAATGTSLSLTGNVTSPDHIFGTSGPSAKSSINARAARQGLVFDGTANSAVSAAVPAFGTSDFTVSAIITTDLTVNLSGVIGGNQAGAFGLFIVNTGQLGIQNTGISTVGYSTGVVTANKATQVTYTRSGTTGTFYIAGVASGTITDSTNYSQAINFVGQVGGLNIWKGSVAPLIYNRALSASEVVSLFEAGVPAGADYNSASNTSLLTGANSDFSSAGNWNVQGATTISGGKLNLSNGDAAYNGLALLTVGKRYRLTITVDSLTAGVVQYYNGSSYVTFASTAGTYTVEFTCAATFAPGLHLRSSGGNAVLDTALYYTLGLLLAPDAAQAGGGLTWYDTSGNAANITLPASGVAWAVPTSGKMATSLNVNAAASLFASTSNSTSISDVDTTAALISKGSGTPRLYFGNDNAANRPFVQAGVGGGALFMCIQPYGGNALFGSLTDSGNGKIQLATHTTSAGGIGFGTDVSLYRDSAGSLVQGAGANNAILTLSSTLTSGSGGQALLSLVNASQAWSVRNASGSFGIRNDTGGAYSLTIDTSNNATFVGKVTTNAISGINALAAGTQLATFESSVNGAAVELITKGKNSTGTARQANIGLNRFADDVMSISDGTTERLRLGLTNGNLTVTGALKLGNAYTAGAPTATGYVTIQDSAGNTYKVLVGT